MCYQRDLDYTLAHIDVQLYTDRQTDRQENGQTDRGRQTLGDVLQTVAVCCRLLQCVAVHCRVLQCVAEYCNALQCVAVRCSVLLQCVAMHT